MVMERETGCNWNYEITEPRFRAEISFHTKMCYLSREIREHAAVRHVVPVDRDEERSFRAVGVNVWGAVAALAERIKTEILPVA